MEGFTRFIPHTDVGENLDFTCYSELLQANNVKNTGSDAENNV